MWVIPRAVIETLDNALNSRMSVEDKSKPVRSLSHTNDAPLQTFIIYIWLWPVLY